MLTFGEYIHALRGEQSMEKVCDVADISPSVLSRIETGERKDMKVSTLIGLAKALNTSEMRLISAFKGQDPEAIDETDSQARKILSDVVKQIPSKVVFEAMSDDEIFKALLVRKGEDKMRELMQEAIRRNQDKGK